MKSIHQRPAAVEGRVQAGHWEGDLLIGAGQRSALATLVERKFRVTMLVPVARDHSARSVADALIAAFGALPAELRRTLTWDQGNEMFQHERIEEATGLRIYFADPHSPWPRREPTWPHTPSTKSTTSRQSSTSDHDYASLTALRTRPCDNGPVNEYDTDSRRSLESAPGRVGGTATHPSTPPPGR
jgi:hypothetical protein